MAIAPEAGIMALPENQGMAAPQMSMQDSYGAMREALQEARPDADMELQEALAEIKAEISDISDEDLGELISAIQSLYDSPETYTQDVAQLVAEGEIDADDLPAEYDEEFLSAMLMVLIDEQRSRETAGMPQGMAGMMPPPQQFARGGIAEAARVVANQGRRGDTMLAHITPSEARLLKSRGGSGTINPQTGLPEFFIKKIFKAVKKTFKRVADVVKKALKSPIGRIIGTIALGMVLGPAVAAFAPGLGAAGAAAVTSGLSSGIITAASGGSVKDVLKSAALGAFSAPGGPVSNYVGKYTGQYLSNPVVQQAANAAIIGTAGGVLTGESLKDSLKTGLTQGVIAGGITIATGGNAQQAKDNAANTAMDAVDDAATQKAIADFEGPSGVSGTGAQRGASRYQSLGKDATGREVFVDRMTGQPVPAADAARMGLDATSIPKPGIGQGVTDAQAASQGTSTGIQIPSSTASAIPTDLKSGIFGTPQAQQAMTAPGVAIREAAARAAESGIPTTVAMPSSTGPAPAYQPQTVMESLGSMGSGAKKFLTGDFREGASQFAQGAEDLLMPGPSSAQYKDMMDDAIAKGMSPSQAADYLEKTGAVPGFMRTYGPATVAGIGALGLAGGFTPKPPPESEFAEQMRQPIDLSGNPSKYYIQGLPGVQYDERGQITGSSPWSAPQTMQNVTVPTQSYTNYQPRFMNAGGIAALNQGGYPRRTGQISGPGTEKSDSIPAMLSDGEFVMTAKAVRGAGGGSRRDGAKRMYALMHQLERNASRG
jgi:hypothetical protein